MKKFVVEGVLHYAREGGGPVRHTVEDRYIDAVAAAGSNKEETTERRIRSGENNVGSYVVIVATGMRVTHLTTIVPESLSRHAAASSSAGNAAARVSFVSMMLSEAGDDTLGPISAHPDCQTRENAGFLFTIWR